MTIIAAADGSALGNPGPAGWAWYIDDDHWAAGGWPHGTNNMGELKAVLDLLQQTAGSPEELRVLCDSQYVINSLTKWLPGWKRKGWKKSDGKPVLNVELLKELDAALAGRTVRFEWVKGHAGHDLNEAADVRARAAATAYQQGKRPETGPGFAGAQGVGAAGVGAEGAGAEDAGAQGAADPYADLFEPDDIALAADEPRDPQPEPEIEMLPIEGELADEELVISLERSLIADVVRNDPAATAALLHPRWLQFSGTGVLPRSKALAEVGALPRPADLDVLRVERLSPDQVLLLCRVSDSETSALHSALWVREEANWQQRFRQISTEA
ncbi:RNase H family protein [Granulicoccus phenolivorans]|uniref:RNase H family protein n=1 Tax=Granulicoccus phenolivorans TaxID=266854 RepID=UPI000408D617|nr:RNase H family protein [Granulicoccus phenolivorans]